jgi:hypothetical protein
MADVLTASSREKLWHKMRQDLCTYVPEIAGNQLLMCCTCGRFLPQEHFDLDHLIPQQALKHDPDAVRADPTTPANTRAGNLLLCKKPLNIKGDIVYRNGCNSWKGKFFDRFINELISAKVLNAKDCMDTHIIAALTLCYLAIVEEFGYIISLMPSGLVLREQFFRPHKFHHQLPLYSSMFLAGDTITASHAPVWARPFSFDFPRPGVCTVGARNFARMLPVSNDPREPIARHLRIAPAKYNLRPNFRTVFE